MSARNGISLEMMTQEVVSKAIINCIQGSFERLKEFHKWSPHIWCKKINRIQEECKRLKEYLLGSNSVVLQNMILPIIHRTFTLLTDFCLMGYLYVLDGAKYVDIRNTCLCILGSVFIPCIQQLDVTMCDDFSLGLAIENLGLICNIKKLILISNVIPLTLSLQEKIGVLTKLRELYCNNCCTNEILTTVADFCQELILLDVRNSWEVDDSSVHNINRLLSLRILDVRETSITHPGYLKILQSLPELYNIFWVIPVEELVRDLPYQYTTKYVVAGVTTVVPAIFCMKCTNISRLYITSLGKDIDMSVFSELRQLTNFGMKLFNFEKSKMNRLLQMSGRMLKVLSLQFVYDVDFFSIVNYCCNLTSLNLRNCELFMTSPVDMEQAVLHFKSLKFLNLYLNIACTYFYRCIGFYQNLLQFHIMDTSEINDNFVRNWVKNNVFKDLVVFFSVKCPLSSSTADLLIDNCSNLKKIGDLNFWDIDNSGIQELEEMVCRLHLDLQFVHKQPFTYEES